jgi:hypothetical protein
VDDYISIPQCDLVAGDAVTFKFIAPTTPSGVRETMVARLNPTGAGSFYFELYEIGNTYRLSNCEAKVDGVSITSSTPFPTDGLEHTAVLTITSSTNIGTIGRAANGLHNYRQPIYDIDIQAVIGNRRYLINDGWAANPVIADSIGGVNGTAVNFNESNWIYYK